MASLFTRSFRPIASSTARACSECVAVARRQPIASSSSRGISQIAIKNLGGRSLFRGQGQGMWNNVAKRGFASTSVAMTTMNQVARGARKSTRRLSKSPLLEQCYQKKAVISKVYTSKPKKPNSAVRKVVRVKLSTGKTTIAYVPGEGHNLQEHAVVLVRGGRTKDLPGVRYKLIRGALDFGAVASRTKSRSKYGAKKPKKA